MCVVFLSLTGSSHTGGPVDTVFYDLPHPPATYMGNQYRWRTADGSYNNVQIPDMGKAGTPYSRSVQAVHPLDRGELPDPELLYKALLKREEVGCLGASVKYCFG